MGWNQFNAAFIFLDYVFFHSTPGLGMHWGWITNFNLLFYRLLLLLS